MAEFTDKPGYAFDPGPPPEASRFLRNKGLKPGFSWADVEPEEHAVAFCVAMMADLDMLEAAKGELQRALDEGTPYAAFKKAWRGNPTLSRWWGLREMTDPETGEVVPVHIGERRLRNIYRSNLRTARAAGQWERIERTRRTLPYLLYQLGPSERHRPHHASKEGLVLLVDDPFWDEWMPPNGWGCKCWVRQLSRTEAEGRGIDTAPTVGRKGFRNFRTGAVRTVPTGIDPGWDRNPGKLRREAMAGLLADRLDAADPAIARAAARDMAASWRARRLLLGQAGGSVPVAMLTGEAAGWLGTRTRVVTFSEYTATKSRDRHPEVTPESLARIADTIETGEVVRETTAEGGANLVFQTREDKPWRLVLKRTASGETFLSTFHRSTTGKWNRYQRRPGIERLRE